MSYRVRIPIRIYITRVLTLDQLIFLIIFNSTFDSRVLYAAYGIVYGKPEACAAHARNFNITEGKILADPHLRATYFSILPGRMI